jgi:hypothetical protein
MLLFSAPLADFRYLNASIIRTSNVTDGEPLPQEQARLIHCGLPRADLAGNQVAFINLVSIINDPCHWLHAAADHSPKWRGDCTIGCPGLYRRCYPI